jgi:hypothetical protein
MTVLLPPTMTAVAAASTGLSYTERAGIMSSTTETRTAISSVPPAAPRLLLQPDGPACTLLDGGRTHALLSAAGLSRS